MIDIINRETERRKEGSDGGREGTHSVVFTVLAAVTVTARREQSLSVISVLRKKALQCRGNLPNTT